ncbi:MAG: 1-acyl-sn-glycerol-3-phosphate acyltransferase [Myxococcaceae bacterium]|nr:1-acyl-sn-glycerol-3-phosphate acyltransferase [Myxococcaceae bacterium]
MSPNNLWRLFASALGFVFFGVSSLVWLPMFVVLLALPLSVSTRQRWSRALIGTWFLAFVHVLRMLGVCTWNIEGQARLGRPGQVIIANHPMFLDIVFLLAFAHGGNCVIKSALRKNPFLTLPILGAGYIENDAAEPMLEKTAAALGAGESLVMFPEGTRTVPGQPIAFQRGAAHVALKAARVLTPVVLTCEPLTFTKGKPWYQVPERKWHFQITVGDDIALEPFRAKGDSPIAARRLTEYLQRHFESELERRDAHDSRNEAIVNRVA